MAAAAGGLCPPSRLFKSVQVAALAVVRSIQTEALAAGVEEGLVEAGVAAEAAQPLQPAGILWAGLRAGVLGGWAAMDHAAVRAAKRARLWAKPVIVTLAVVALYQTLTAGKAASLAGQHSLSCVAADLIEGASLLAFTPLALHFYPLYGFAQLFV